MDNLINITRKSTLILMLLSLNFIPFNVNGQDAELEEGDRVLCNCGFFGTCRASNNGSLCAQSEEGGNINCKDYNGNC